MPSKLRLIFRQGGGRSSTKRGARRWSEPGVKVLGPQKEASSHGRIVTLAVCSSIPDNHQFLSISSCLFIGNLMSTAVARSAGVLAGAMTNAGSNCGGGQSGNG